MDVSAILDAVSYSIILDIIIIVIAAIAIIRGAIKGLVTTLFDMFTFVGAIALAAAFKNPLAELLKSTPLFEGAKNTVTSAMTNAIKNAGDSLDPSGLIEALGEKNSVLSGIIEMFGTDISELQAYVATQSTQTWDTLAENAARYIIEPAASVCSEVIAFALIFALSLLGLWLLKKLLNLIFKLPGLSAVNRGGGIILGIVAAILYSSLFVALTAPLLSNTQLFGFTLPQNFIGNSFIYSFIYENNIFYFFLSLFKAKP